MTTDIIQTMVNKSKENIKIYYALMIFGIFSLIVGIIIQILILTSVYSMVNTVNLSNNNTAQTSQLAVYPFLSQLGTWLMVIGVVSAVIGLATVSVKRKSKDKTTAEVPENNH